MDAMKVNQQMLDLQKQSFANFQSLWELTQTQTAGIIDQAMNQTQWMPNEGHQAMEQWLTLMKKERERYIAYVDRGFAIYEKMFTTPQAAAAPKPKKTSTAK